MPPISLWSHTVDRLLRNACINKSATEETVRDLPFYPPNCATKYGRAFYAQDFSLHFTVRLRIAFVNQTMRGMKQCIQPASSVRRGSRLLSVNATQVTGKYYS